jgi:hypothetical protein
MSSPESREARQKRMKRQAQGSRDALRMKPKRRPRDPAPGPSWFDRAVDPWADEYQGEPPHDEDYYLEHELDFNDGH